jgi:hypothetical protein
MAAFTFRWGPFFAAFAVGMLIVYAIEPPIHVVMKYPNPDDAATQVYRDITGGHYKYVVEDVECKKDAVEQPVAGKPMLASQ